MATITKTEVVQTRYQLDLSYDEVLVIRFLLAHVQCLPGSETGAQYSKPIRDLRDLLESKGVCYHRAEQVMSRGPHMFHFR